jgi:hypothetical protein
MTDPTSALESFQQSLAAGEISPQKGRVHNDLWVLFDHANGVPRMTYALAKGRSVVALVILVSTQSLNGAPCFNLGYAVDAGLRSRGFGKEVLQKALDELKNGFQNREGGRHMYIEAVVARSNYHSQKLAARLISGNPKECVDNVSQEPALQYVLQLF